MTELRGKTALVTAAGQGIGRASAIALAAAGARVIATDVDIGALRALGNSHAIETSRLDVTEREAIDALVVDAGPIDILFNCAGVVHGGTILDARDDDLEKAQMLNVAAMVYTIQAVLPSMIDRREGSIINMASVASALKGVPNRFVYSVTKAAVLGLTKSVAADFVRHNIRCNAICPGTVNTPSLQERLAADGQYEANLAAFLARQPIGRFASPEEIADLVVFLAGAGYVTGQAIAIDGGWTI